MTRESLLPPDKSVRTEGDTMEEQAGLQCERTVMRGQCSHGCSVYGTRYGRCYVDLFKNEEV